MPRGDKGQSTLEFLLVAMALAAMCIALAAMWHAARDGRLLELASTHAAHSSKAGIAVALKDLFEY